MFTALPTRFGAFAKLLGLLLAIVLVAAACGSADSVVSEQADEAADAAEEAAAEEEAMEDEEEAMEDEEEAMEDDEPAEEEAMEDEEEAMEDEEPAEEEAVVTEDAAPAEDLVIVSMSPTATEMLFAIGAGDLVVAADNNSNFPPEAPLDESLTSFPVNVEGIIAFGPTHVVSSGPIEGLDAVGIENVIVPFAATFDDTYTQLEQLGALTGNVGEAAEVVGQIQTDLEAIVASTEVPEGLSYYHELDNTFFSATSSTFIGQVYGLFGLENVADAADPDGEAFGFPQLTEEFLVTADPDLIFLADTICCGQTAETVAARPGWDTLSAVTNGNVIELNDDIASRWGPRIVDYTQAIADAISQLEVAEAS